MEINTVRREVNLASADAITVTIGHNDPRPQQLDPRELDDQRLGCRKRRHLTLEDRSKPPLLYRELVLTMTVDPVQRPLPHRGHQGMLHRPSRRGLLRNREDRPCRLLDLLNSPGSNLNGSFIRPEIPGDQPQQS